jgi:hypothetical protein
MRRLAALLAVLGWSILAVHAGPIASLGYSDDVTVVNGGSSDGCIDNPTYFNHDGSFENGYAWQYGGIAAPYYGAFGEGFYMGSHGDICCGGFCVSTLPGYFTGQSADVYVWEGGAGYSAPGAVLDVVPGIVFTNVPDWPAVGMNTIEMNVYVPDEFTIGYWGNWPDALLGYFCAADLNGPGGHPWTNIAPGIGYPSGWNDPSIVWGPTQAMGMGVAWHEGGPGWICNPWTPPPIPARSSTWGSIKHLFE